jgi:multiple sugar transport system substrate-binding protein
MSLRNIRVVLVALVVCLFSVQVFAQGDFSGTLRVFYQSEGDTSYQQMMEMAGQKLTEMYPNVTVEFNTAPPVGYIDQLNIAIAGGAPPDVFMTRPLYLNDYGPTGIATDLTPFLERDALAERFVPNVIDAFTATDGKLYALPRDLALTFVAYNKDIFDAAGAAYPTGGWTLEDWLATGAGLLVKDDAGDTTQYGGAYIFEFDPIFALLQVEPNGGKLYSDDGLHWVAASDEYLDINAAAMQRLADGVTSGNMPDYTTITDNGFPDTMFSTGMLAMTNAGLWSTQMLQQVPFNWGVVTNPHTGPAPTEMTVLVGMAIAEASQQKDLAWEYLKLLTGDEAQAFLAESGASMPVNAAVRASDSWLNSPGLPEPLKAALPDLIAALDAYGVFVPNHKVLQVNYSGVQQIWNKYSAPIDLGQMSARDALLAMDEEMQAYFESERERLGVSE